MLPFPCAGEEALPASLRGAAATTPPHQSPPPPPPVTTATTQHGLTQDRLATRPPPPSSCVSVLSAAPQQLSLSTVVCINLTHKCVTVQFHEVRVRTQRYPE
ncbi:hypothetical protein E2C01_081668 [Portunus trituberculatus]|uniref:Uncharacterized protein n=1 Tax=Portunus trituberculatus TaxID=210409 RepID=A0A5B7ISH2_PORTR|nr:hypothetical protein [Portunus trituberculatus]